MKEDTRMQRIWNYDENTPISQSISPGHINIPMHKLKGDSKRNSVINDIDEDDSSVVWEVNSPSSNVEYKGVDHDLDEEAANELTKVIGLLIFVIRCLISYNILMTLAYLFRYSNVYSFTVNRPIFQNTKSKF